MLRRERSKQQMKRGSDCSSNSGEQSLLNTGNTSESVAKCGSSGVKSVSDINPALSTRGDHACPPYIPAPTRPADSLVSTDSVSHKTTLDHLAHLHSKIITGALAKLYNLWCNCSAVKNRSSGTKSDVRDPLHCSASHLHPTSQSRAEHIRSVCIGNILSTVCLLRCFSLMQVDLNTFSKQWTTVSTLQSEFSMRSEGEQGFRV